MNIKKSGKILMMVCLSLVLALVLALPASAVDDVPSAVLDARNGVVRIIAIGSEGAATGSGFIIGTPGQRYIATNHHVVEGSETFCVFYDSGHFVLATIVHDDPARDICILKTEGSIPRGRILQLETGPVDNGIGVFALGFPAAADYFTTGDNQQFSSVDEFLRSVIADKQSMTITNGIVSAVHNSVLIGDGSRQVKILQTNTAINGGNSGGPLLNRDGRVVGINTMGIIVADAMNGSVHVEELVAVLNEAGIEYQGTPEQVVSSAPASLPESIPVATTNTSNLMALVVGFMVVVAVAGVIAIIVITGKKKKPPVKGGITLEQFERGYRKVDEVATLEMVRRFVQELLPLAGYDLNPLLTPQNVIIGDDTITLLEKGADRQPMPALYSGFSAPECYQGRAASPATVYFIGALIYTLTTGRRPPEGQSRSFSKLPMFKTPNAIQALTNRATDPEESLRIQDLYGLNVAIEQATPAVYADNGIHQ